MQLKEESQSFPRKRFHMVKRFKKARTFAKSLNDLISSTSQLPEGVASLYKLEAQVFQEI